MVPSTEKVEPPAKKIRPVAAPTIGVPYGALDDFQYHSPKMVAVMPKVPLVDDNEIIDLGSLTLQRFSFLPISLQDLDTLLLCSHELLLPDFSTLHTRMLLGAWEEGLETVSEEAASMLMLALQVPIVLILNY